MKEEPPDDGMISGGGDGGGPHMMQHLQGGVPGGGLLGQQDGTLLSHAALQAALMASLAAQQASQLQYQQALLGPAGLRLPQGHPLSSASHALQQREALLAWSKLAAQSAGSVRFPPPISMQPLPQVSNNKLDDSGIQTSPKVDSTSNSASSSLLTPYGLLRHDSTGGGTPSPTNSSPPTNGSSGGGSTRTQSEKKTPGSREKVFVCQICNRSFGYKHVLQNHERTHTGEKPFECKECHKRFTRDHHLKTHMRLHTGEKPYHCSHCDRQFVQVANLRRHLRVHTGERPYACELCESKFSDSNQLKAHMLIHKGEKPFRCEHCFGTYRRRHHLMHHRCSREPTHTSLIGGLLGSEEDHEVDSEARSDASSGERMKSLSVTDVVGLGGGVDVGGDAVVDDSMGLPSDLSTHRHPSVTNEADEFGQDLRRRGRKQKETRRVIRVPEMSSTVTSCYPEQTEPEDLSLHSARSIEYKTSAEFTQHQNPVFSSQQA